MDQNNFCSFDIRIRSTFLIPIVKAIVLQIVFLAIYAVLLWNFNHISSTPLKSGGIIVFLVLQSLQSFWVVVIVMKWFFKYYEISHKEIVCNEGILFQKRRSYSLEKAESVVLNQSFLGRIFNFGTIVVELYMANSRYEVRLHRISSPRKYVNLIEQTLSQFGDSNEENRDD